VKSPQSLSQTTSNKPSYLKLNEIGNSNILSPERGKHPVSSSYFTPGHFKSPLNSDNTSNLHSSKLISTEDRTASQSRSLKRSQDIINIYTKRPYLLDKGEKRNQLFQLQPILSPSKLARTAELLANQPFSLYTPSSKLPSYNSKETSPEEKKMHEIFDTYGKFRTKSKLTVKNLPPIQNPPSQISTELSSNQVTRSFSWSKRNIKNMKS